MPRWPTGYVASTYHVCPKCGGKKDYYAAACRKCATYKKPHLGKSGPEHPCWKGGQRVDRDGYIRLYLPNHPWPRRGGYVLAHVAAMEISIGRRIKQSEVVHHKDGNRQNNALSNLELMTASKHSSIHRKSDTHKRKRINGRFA